MLLVHRVPEGSEVSLAREESPAFLDLRVNQVLLETRDYLDGSVVTDRRANQEIPVIRAHWDRTDPEECRVRTAGMVTDPQDLEVQRVIPVSLVIPVFGARRGCRDPKDIQGPKGTVAEGVTLVCRESREFPENQDIRDTGGPEVLLEAKP